MLFLILATIASLPLQPQATDSRNPDPLFGPPPRVTIATSATALPVGWKVMATVTPMPGIHVYAPGNQGYIAVSFAVTLPAGWKATAAAFPEAEPYVFGELKEVVNVYQKPFIITQTVTPSARGSKSATTLVGSFKYQACTDRVCYPPQEQTVNVALPVAASPTKKHD